MVATPIVMMAPMVVVAYDRAADTADDSANRPGDNRAANRASDGALAGVVDGRGPAGGDGRESEYRKEQTFHDGLPDPGDARSDPVH